MQNQQILTKKCPKCQEFKSFDNFYKDKKTTDLLTCYCKKCYSNYYINNIEHIKIYRTTTRQQRTKTHNEWINKNRTRHNKNRRLKSKQKRQTNPNFKLRQVLTNRINHALVGIGSKSQKTIKLIGYSTEEYKKYIQQLFQSGMTWKNHGHTKGHWQIHHICPIEFFDLTDPIEQKQAFHYTNTKPLWYEDHCEEHRKINERMNQLNLGNPMDNSLKS